MRRAGRLLAVADGLGVVELDAGSACARCARGRGCGAALFAPAGAPLRLGCALAGPLRPGTRVEIDVPDEGARWLRPVLLAYGLPTAGLVAGAFAPEPWTPLGALAGLAGGLLAWRLTSRSAGSGPRPGPCALVARTSPIDRSAGTPPDREERSA